MKCTWCIVLSLAGLAIGIEHDFKGFDDSILFGLNWPGPLENVENLVEGEETPKPPESTLTKEILRVMSSDQEKYECHLPEVKDKQSTNIDDYEGPSPLELLNPLFSQKICTYRLESYWNYEVCHGRYVRQYHEEREGKSVKIQEFYLGQWTGDLRLKLIADLEAMKTSEEPMRTTKVEGMTLPYVEMLMRDGTVCDLSGSPRQTRVLYVCYSHGKHEVHSFKETSTCEYEIIILSPLLCQHPQFKPTEVSENSIMCYSVDSAPKKPRGALQMDIESLVFHHQTSRIHASTDNEVNAKDILAVLKVEKIVDKDGQPHLQFELQPLDDDVPTTSTPSERSPSEKPPGLSQVPTISHDSPVRAFLNGENCLNGGTGWWKYEFCYGKHVLQYHIDRNGHKNSLLLGTFDVAAHNEWMYRNKAKQPKPIEQRTSVSHLYTNGDICDKTGKPRETEVKLKCLENSSDPAQVSLYLLEPRTCHYILGVESPLICEILPLVNENGLLKENLDSEPKERGTDQPSTPAINEDNDD